MQNDEYYDLYIEHWQKILGQKETVTKAEQEELHELLESQKGTETHG